MPVLQENTDFTTHYGLEYHWCGKFVAPSSDWIHLTRNLTDYELIVVTEGVLKIGTSKRSYTVHPHEYLIMAPDPYQHGTEKCECTFFWMHFNPIEMDLKTAAAFEHLKIPVQGKLQNPDRIIVLMKELQDSDRRYRNAYLNSCLTSAVITELFLQCQNPAESPQIHRDALYRNIVDYISWHIGERLFIKDIADYFGYNEKYLTTFFGAHSGMPLKQFILRAKCDRARAMLSDTDKSISEISYSLGYTDVRNFSNIFKRITGLSPAKYRETYDKRYVFRK